MFIIMNNPNMFNRIIMLLSNYTRYTSYTSSYIVNEGLNSRRFPSICIFCCSNNIR